MRWGRLHDFAIDSMRFALEQLDFEALTIVDSDQLLVRPGYVTRVREFTDAHPEVGMLGNAPGPQPRSSRVDPVRVAWREPELWRPLLSRLPGGSAAFPHWTFWPSTVFTRRAAADLVRLFDEGEVERILRRSRIWATEEIVLPTLAAALGHEIALHPGRYDYVRYRVGYTMADLDRAFASPDVYWIHPIPRVLDDPLRARIRDTIGSRSPRLVADRSPATQVTAKQVHHEVGAVRGGVDALSLGLLTTIVDQLRANPEPPRLVAPARPTPIGIAMSDLLDRYSIREQPPDAAGDRRQGARRPLDAAILDGTVGLVGFAESATRSATRLRPGCWLAVAGASASSTAIVRCLASAWEGSTVEQTDSLVAVRKPDSAPGAAVPSRAFESIRRHVERTLGVEGWLEPDEATLLAVAATASLAATSGKSIVELGSFCGRATVLLGGIAQAHAHGARVYAIDRFDGIVGEAGGRLYECGSTIDRFRQAIAAAGVDRTVRAVVGPTAETAWDRPIGLLVVDALHDYDSVERDFRHYEPWLDAKALIGFHDYADYFAGVRRFVNGLLTSGRYAEVGRVRSLIVIRRAAVAAPAAAATAASPARDGLRLTSVTTPASIAPVSRHARRPEEDGQAAAVAYRPLVSCIMPTYDRRSYVPDAVARFLAQDYPERELIVVDDGRDAVADLMPHDERVHYVRIPNRLTIGAKRNLACELASGEILAHWDDDDWVASWRLRYEVDALLASGADIVGLSTLLYYDGARGQAWRYQYRGSNRPWVHDPTFCYRREVWQAERFPDTNFGLDTRYLRSGRQKRVQALADHRFYVGTIHPGNTSPKNTREASWTPIPVGDVHDLMSEDESKRSRSAGVAGSAEHVAV
jgi:hypothetical protein